MRVLRLLFTLGVVLVSLPAQAESSDNRARLRYTRGQGAEQCPDETTIRDSVAARLGYVPWDEHARRTIIVAIAADGGSLRARVELRDAAGKISGVRELTSPTNDCRDLAAAIEVAISIAVDPLTFAPPAEPPAAPQPETHAPTPAPRPPAQQAPAPSPDDRAIRRLHFSASVGGVVAVGSAPSVAGGVTLQGRMRWRNVSFAVEGRVDVPAYRDVEGGQISTSLLVGNLLACYHYHWLSGCGLFAAGAMRAAAHGLPDPETVTLAYLAGGARVGLEVPLFSILSLRVHADLLASFSRITLRQVGVQTELWSSPPLSGAFGLAVLGNFL